jgi:hypothetical protein
LFFKYLELDLIKFGIGPLLIQGLVHKSGRK